MEKANNIKIFTLGLFILTSFNLKVEKTLQMNLVRRFN
jgi:hypothetical protein